MALFLTWCSTFQLKSFYTSVSNTIQSILCSCNVCDCTCNLYLVTTTWTVSSRFAAKNNMSQHAARTSIHVGRHASSRLTKNHSKSTLLQLVAGPANFSRVVLMSCCHEVLSCIDSSTCIASGRLAGMEPTRKPASSKA